MGELDAHMRLKPVRKRGELSIDGPPWCGPDRDTMQNLGFMATLPSWLPIVLARDAIPGRVLCAG
jgi:hypothetical protein